MQIQHTGRFEEWLLPPSDDWNRAVTIGPAGFEAYARLRFMPDPTHPGQTEGDGARALPDDHPHDLPQLVRLVELVTPRTSTPDDAFVAAWEGWPWDDALRRSWGPPAIENGFRSYHVLRGPLHQLNEWPTHTAGCGYAPSFIWPADRAWCVTSDVDPHWAGIGGTREAITHLIDAARDGEPALDIVPTTRGAQHPLYA